MLKQLNVRVDESVIKYVAQLRSILAERRDGLMPSQADVVTIAVRRLVRSLQKKSGKKSQDGVDNR